MIKKLPQFVRVVLFFKEIMSIGNAKIEKVWDFNFLGKAKQ